MIDDLFAHFRSYWPEKLDEATADAYQTPGGELAEDDGSHPGDDEGKGEEGDVNLAMALGVPGDFIERMTPTKPTAPKEEPVPTRTSPSKVGTLSAEEAREKRIQDLKHFVQNWHCSEFLFQPSKFVFQPSFLSLGDLGPPPFSSSCNNYHRLSQGIGWTKLARRRRSWSKHGPASKRKRRSR